MFIGMRTFFRNLVSRPDPRRKHHNATLRTLGLGYVVLEPRQLLADGTLTSLPASGFFGSTTPGGHRFTINSITQQVTNLSSADAPITIRGFMERVDGRPFSDGPHRVLANDVNINVFANVTGSGLIDFGNAINDATVRQFDATDTRLDFTLALNASLSNGTSQVNVLPGCYDLMFNVAIPNLGYSFDVQNFSTSILVNRVPVEATTAFATNEDTAFTGTLATDPDGDVLQYQLITPPANGQVVFNSNGTFTYSPAVDNDSNTTFTYDVTDGHLTAPLRNTVSVTVNPINDGPRYSGGLNSTAVVGQPQQIEVLSDLVDLEGDGIDLGTLEISESPIGPWMQTLTLPQGTAQVVSAGGTKVVEYTAATNQQLMFYYRVADDNATDPQFMSNNKVPNPGGVPRSISVTSILKPTFSNYVDDVPYFQGTFEVKENGRFQRRFSNDATPLFNGTAEPGSTVTLVGLPAANTPASTIADATGKWSFQIANPLFDADYTIRVDSSKNANFASSDEIVFSVDTVQPGLPTNLVLPNFDDEEKSDTRPPVQQIDEPANRVNWDQDGVSFSPDQMSFTHSTDPGAASGVRRYQINVNGGQFRNITDLVAPFDFSLPAIFDLVGSPTFVQAGVTNRIRIRTIDVAGNVSAPSNNFWVEYDQAKPQFVGNFVTHAGAEPKNIRLDVATLEESVLPVAVITEHHPQISFTIQDQQFAVRNNQLSARLFVDGRPQSQLLTPTIMSYGDSSGAHRPSQITLSVRPKLPLESNQNHELFVRVYDRAGNATDSDKIDLYVSDVGGPTLGAPGTPVHTDLYYLGATVQEDVDRSQNILIVDQNIPEGFRVFIDGEPDGNIGNMVIRSTDLGAGNFRVELEAPIDDSALPGDLLSTGEKVSWLRPWQMSFDKTTQTVWFTMEDGNRIGQFDPATGQTSIYDVSMPANGEPLVSDPHGAFFDFDSHLTPRVWFVYRNDEVGDVARVSYFDVEQKKLFTYDFANLSSLLGFDADETLKESHAIFVDATGDVWLTAEEGGTTEGGSVIQLDFDNGSLGSNVGRAIVHQIPVALGLGDSFHVHGIQVVVDERNADQYVYFLNANQKFSGINQSVLGMLRPADKSDPNSTDQWFSWTISAPSVNSGESHLLFTALDDNETPGIPEDDKAVFSNPGFAFENNGLGIIAQVDVGNVISASRAGQGIPQASPARYVEIDKLPGTDTNKSAPNQTFVDRQGTIFAVDPQSGVIRFDFADAGEVHSLVSNVKNQIDSQHPLSDSIEMSNVYIPDPIIVDTVFAEDSLLSLNDTRLLDRSINDGVDHYEVGTTPERRTSGFGPFRGAINATNVLYGSVSQSDHLSSTVFAETARRQMTVVPSPETPAGWVEGRIAFQVLRDGSLFMTGRADGQILDIQQNISNIVANFRGISPEKTKIAGDASAVVDDAGTVHVFGKQRLENGRIGLVVFSYHGHWNSQAGLSRPENWSVRRFDPPTGNQLLVGDPTALVDARTGMVAAMITTNDGQLLLYKLGERQPIALAPSSNHPVYSSVGILQRGNWIYAYGSNQKGDLIEFGFKGSDVTTAYSRKVSFTKPADHSDRDVRIFQDVEAILVNNKRHVYATDGNSRLVHIEIDYGGNNVSRAENVTKIIAESMTDNDTQNDLAEGYFSFQEPYAGRTYSGLEILFNDQGDQFVYGTNGGELILFINDSSGWRAANLTNDIYSFHGNIDGPNRGGENQAPAERIPGNNVFGSPAGYSKSNNDRHLFQINAEGEVIEYYVTFDESIPRFHTQNINLRIG